MNILQYRTSINLASVIIFVSFIYSCEFSHKEKEARKKSLLLQEQSLQADLEKMNSKLKYLEYELIIANKDLKKAKELRFINPAIINEEIKTQSLKIANFQKEISDLKINITATQSQARKLKIQMAN